MRTEVRLTRSVKNLNCMQLNQLRSYENEMPNTTFREFLHDIFNSDKPQQIPGTEQARDIRPKSGWERVKLIFQTDEFGNVSPEVHSILQTSSLGIVVGVLYGGVIEGRNAYEKFLRNNEVTKFQTPMQARSKLQDTVTIGFGKGAFRWSWRIGMFTSLVIGTATIIQVYKDDYGIMEYAYGGALAGTVYKLYSGPRACIVGGGLGGVLGLIGGACTYGLLKLTGYSMEDTRYWQHRFMERREELIRAGTKEYYDQEESAMYKIHNDEVGETGESLANIENPKKAQIRMILKEE